MSDNIQIIHEIIDKQGISDVACFDGEEVKKILEDSMYEFLKEVNKKNKQ